MPIIMAKSACVSKPSDQCHCWLLDSIIALLTTAKIVLAKQLVMV